MSVHCSEECFKLCDFCQHFLMFKSKEATNIDGSGYCGLHRKEVDACDQCEDFFCMNIEPYGLTVLKRTVECSTEKAIVNPTNQLSR